MNLETFRPIFIEVRVCGDALLVDFIPGRLTEEVNLEQLGHELFALVEQFGCRKLILCLKGVDYLSSAGIGKLITLHRRMHRHQGVVVFCEVHGTVADVFKTTKMDSYFRIVADVEAARAVLDEHA